MSTRRLPARDMPEASKLIAEYLECSNTRVNELAESYGYQAKENFVSAMRKSLGAHRKPQYEPLQRDDKKDLPPIILPEVKLREYQPLKKGKHDPETQILIISDGHAGKITKSYNPKVYEERWQRLTGKVILIANLHRNIYPIKKLHILMLGDMVQGENPYQGSKIGSTEMGGRDQIAKLAMPAITEAVLNLKQHYSEIEIDCWSGNHGSLGKEAPETSSWDLLLYDRLDDVLSPYKIKVHIHEEFGSVIDIEGWRFFCAHLDGIHSQQGVPLMAIARRLDKWYQQFDTFDFAVGGHFHKFLNDGVSAKVEFFLNGTMVSDDDWALKKMGISSAPVHWVFGVHERQGISWRYPLRLDKDYLK